MSAITDQSSVRLDHAIARELAEARDAVAAADLGHFYAAISTRDVSVNTTQGIEPPTLIGALFVHIMPRVSNSRILRTSERQALLRRLEARMTTRLDEAPAVPGSLEAIRLELRNLEAMLAQRDSLIDG